MSIKILKGKDKNGNLYYSDMPIKQINVTLKNTSSGKVTCEQCGKIAFVRIMDIVFNQDIKRLSSDGVHWLVLDFASGLPAPKLSWQVFRCIPNADINDPYIKIQENGILQVTMRGQEKTLAKGKTINASFCYLVK